LSESGRRFELPAYLRHRAKMQEAGISTTHTGQPSGQD
jgi:hypothetical protein